MLINIEYNDIDLSLPQPLMFDFVSNVFGNQLALGNSSLGFIYDVHQW